MADFATAGAADAASFADGEIRKVVVEDKLFLACATGIGIKFLGVLARSQRAKRKRLSFAALKNRGAVRSRKQPDLRMNRTDVIEAATVQPLAMTHDQVANSFFLDVIKRIF